MKIINIYCYFFFYFLLKIIVKYVKNDIVLNNYLLLKIKMYCI